MKRLIMSFGVLMLAAAVAYPVFAHGPGWGRGGHMRDGYGPRCGYDRGYENLTDEQRDQMEDLERKYYDDAADLRETLRRKADELDALLAAAEPDGEKARALQREISELRAELDQKKIDFELETRKISPEIYGRGYGPPMRRECQKRGYGQGGCGN